MPELSVKAGTLALTDILAFKNMVIKQVIAKLSDKLLTHFFRQILSFTKRNNGLTYEEVMNGHSKIRNKAIANIFSQMGLVEAWGSGIKRIINAAKEYGLPEPKFQEFDNMFRVELFRNNSMAGSEKKAGEDSEIIMGYELSDTQKKVMNILFYEYKRFPNLYSSYSAPWYTEALLYSAASFVVIIVCIILRVLIRHKMDKK